jgi:hypothetical protein
MRSNEYIQLGNKLSNCKIISNDLDLLPDQISPEFDCLIKDFSKIDLLAHTHRLIVIKE